MTLIDEIIQKETEFFLDNVRQPEYIIFSPDAYYQLLIELEKDITDNICTYEGLKVAILPTPECSHSFQFA